jgi:hypothetical protein
MEPVVQQIHEDGEEGLLVPVTMTTPPARRAGGSFPARGQSGAMNLSGVLLILVVAAMIFAAFRLLPPYISNYQLQDALENIARGATYNARITAEDIRGEVMTEIRELGIPADESQVEVQRTGVSVNIAVSYTVPVDLLVHQVDLNFEPAAGNRNIAARP